MSPEGSDKRRSAAAHKLLCLALLVYNSCPQEGGAQGAAFGNAKEVLSLGLRNGRRTLQ